MPTRSAPWERSLPGLGRHCETGAANRRRARRGRGPARSALRTRGWGMRPGGRGVVRGSGGSVTSHPALEPVRRAVPGSSTGAADDRLHILERWPTCFHCALRDRLRDLRSARRASTTCSAPRARSASTSARNALRNPVAGRLAKRCTRIHGASSRHRPGRTRPRPARVRSGRVRVRAAVHQSFGRRCGARPER